MGEVGVPSKRGRGRGVVHARKRREERKYKADEEIQRESVKRYGM